MSPSSTMPAGHRVRQFEPFFDQRTGRPASDVADSTERTKVDQALRASDAPPGRRSGRRAGRCLRRLAAALARDLAFDPALRPRGRSSCSRSASNHLQSTGVTISRSCARRTPPGCPCVRVLWCEVDGSALARLSFVRVRRVRDARAPPARRHIPARVRAAGRAPVRWLGSNMIRPPSLFSCRVRPRGASPAVADSRPEQIIVIVNPKPAPPSLYLAFRLLGALCRSRSDDGRSGRLPSATSLLTRLPARRARWDCPFGSAGGPPC